MSAAPRMKAPEGWAFTTALTILGGPADLRVTDAPWWVLYSLCVLGILVISLRTVFPQDSQDKVTWWREHWLMRRHYRCRDLRRMPRRDAGGIGPMETRRAGL
jgi:hypothetical protein